ncbi:MAG: hypothetical protein M0026_15050 [Nocardiopsaceae bacterium]|nr:hypothetical protein [Nocardiopsaceae bacterium]
MRFVSSSPALRGAAAAGAAFAAGVLLAGCSELPFDTDDLDIDGLPTEGASASPDPSADAAAFALPESCADIGAAEVVGDLAPEGAVLDEEAGEVEDVPDAEQVSCFWYDSTAQEPGGESFALVFTVNTDPSDNAEVVRVPGEQEEMNWEVDVDVDVDSYHTDAADELGGELKYVSTVEGSSKHLYLSLPGEFHVSATAMSSDAAKEDLEKVVLAAAQQVQQ